MTRRAIIGSRGSDSGIWVSRSGVDAQTALGDDLLLSLTSRTEQIILTGIATGLPRTVVLGLPQRPYVFLTSTAVIPIELNASQSQQNTAGLLRPYPWPTGAGYELNCSADVSASSMTISGGSASVYYVVVRRAV